MFKNKTKWTGVVLALVMVLVFTTPIFAQGDVDPVETPEVVEEPSNIFDHPIVKLIAEFFADLFKPSVVVVDEGSEPEVGGGGSIGEDPPLGDEPLGGDSSTEGDPEPEPVIIPEEAVAAMHEDEDLGFGEIVKLMGIVEAAQATCAETRENCEVTLDSLLAEYKDGTGMGDLFEEYGKPEHLGVGHIRKELEPVGQVKNEHTKREKTNNGKAKGKDK
jgi:hypothetical protein